MRSLGKLGVFSVLLLAGCNSALKLPPDAVVTAEQSAKAIEASADLSCPGHAAQIRAAAASMRFSIQLGVAESATIDINELTRLAKACKVEKDFAGAEQKAASFATSAHSRCPHQVGTIEKHQLDLKEAIQNGWGADAANSFVDALTTDETFCGVRKRNVALVPPASA